MRSIQRLTLVALLASAIVCGCESGSSEGPEPISFAPAPPPAGTGFVALYAPPVDVVPYPNDLYNPTGTRLAVPVKITSPLVAALNTLDGFSTTAVISAPFNAPLDPASLIPFNPLSMAPSAASIIVLNATAGTPLVPGLHYTVRVSTAAGSGNSVLEIVPLRPLAPRTRYAFIVTNRDPQHGRRRGRRRPRIRRRARRASRGPDERPGPARVDALVSGDYAALEHRGRPRHPRQQRHRRVEHADAVDQQRARRHRRHGDRAPRRTHFRRHYHRAARPRPAGHREHLHGLHRGAVLRRPGESAHELLGQLVARAAERAEPDADPARAEPAHSAARDAAERRQRPHAAELGLARRDFPARHHAESHRDVRDGRCVRAGGVRRRCHRSTAARRHGHGEPVLSGREQPVRQQRAPLQSRQRRRHGHVHARRADRQRLADPERRQPAQRARSHPPSRRRLDCADAHAARA